MPTTSLKTWTTGSGTVTRIAADGSPKQGCGNNKRLYVGRISSQDYRSYLKPTLDWTGVGKIVRAVLVLYTDNGLSRLPIGATADSPRGKVRRLTSKFTEGGNTDEDFDTSDWTAPGSSSSGQVTHTFTKEADGLARIDVTKLVDLFAPTGVKRSNGATGTPIAYHGFGIFPYSTDGKYAWAGWSEDATGDAINLKPFIELTYEQGPTTPDTPTLSEPIGTVTTFTGFEGSFSDPRPTDKLASSRVQVYSTARTCTVVAATNVFTSANHGLANGSKVYLTAITGGDGLSTFSPYFVVSRTTSTFKLSTTSGGAEVNVASDGSAIALRTLVYDRTSVESDAARAAGAFDHDPTLTWTPKVNTSYVWRALVTDNEGKNSAWTALSTFLVSNTAPSAPATSPTSGSYATLDGVQFKAGPFVDADSGDRLRAFQMQLSAYAAAAPEWDDAEFLLWDSGPLEVPLGTTTATLPYGGRDLAAGTYYWRARVFDRHGVPSAWTTKTITLTADFESDADEVPTTFQLRPRAPWRIVVKEMKFNTVGGTTTGDAATNVFTTSVAHGLRPNRAVRLSAFSGGTGLVKGQTYYIRAIPSATTFSISETIGGIAVDFTSNVTAGTLTAVTTRGPGRTVAVLEDAHNVGASLLYNSPGEAHWTLGLSHPQISVIEPRQTHYAIEFRQGDGWREVFAGLIMDFDASDKDVVFYGTDYLGLLDFTIDEHYNAANIEASSDKGGSKYVNKTITQIVTDQLKRAREPVNSPVGFISTGTIAAMDAVITVYSTYQQTLPFIVSLLDSHKAGRGVRSRLHVKRTGDGTYAFTVTDDPGVIRENLRMVYGELVQGYRIVPFGGGWATRVSAVGRDKNGVKVRYASAQAPGVDENVWGRWNVPTFIDGVADANDMTRRTKQAVVQSSRLGKSIALGLRSGVLQPRDGYDLMDIFPVDIEHGSVSTDAMGSGYWVAVGITWQALQRGDLNTTLTLHPREDGAAISPDLLTLQPLATQAEWQIGWQPPSSVTATSSPTSQYWLDQTDGRVYERTEGGLVLTGITATI